MGLLSRFFAPKDPLENLRDLARDERWADLLRQGEDPKQGLHPEARAEWLSLVTEAGDRLAELNLTEGEACLRTGDRERALEHFHLAADQGRAPALCAAAQKRLADLSAPAAVNSPAKTKASSCCASGCASTASSSAGEADMPDPETCLELVLASYPSDLADRYRRTGTAFRLAFLAAHEGRDAEALAGFEALPAEERDDLFYFERGALRARMGDIAAGRRDLEQAVVINSVHPLAYETLVRLDFHENRLPEAEARLQRMLSANLTPAFCHGCLARLRAAEGNLDAALVHGEEALREGPAEMEVLLLTANLYERAGRCAEAEGLLKRLPSSGCGGAPHVLLAEFWLRRGQFLKKALQSFRAEASRDPANPRWPLRMAQACADLGRFEDGRPWLERLPTVDELAPDLRHEADEILMRYGK
ncbi:MAG: tetratricopeptide repeat protein [Trichloromonas sp.]|jgi:tetratricopeptide (TPR) repeat protein|nr:tetratricopeptide repeat protein [Trichloromonas sp.]